MLQGMSDRSSQPQMDIEDVHDVLIIGAGPCGLAVAARLREEHPSAIFTDSEQSRYDWMARNAHRATVKNKSNGRLRQPSIKSDGMRDPSMLVLDSSGDEWLTRWHALFSKLRISHLRSPMFFHPDPSDRDALLAYAHTTEQYENTQEIAGCVGKELSKHQKKKLHQRRREPDSKSRPAVSVDERDRKDYFAPSYDCFKDFCRSCAQRYKLDEDVVRRGYVIDLDYGSVDKHHTTEHLFTIRTTNDQFLARTVVLAVGQGEPVIPAPFSRDPPPVTSHVMHTPGADLLTPALKSKIKAGATTYVLVIGGGLTSAQVVDNAVRMGVSHVWLLMRGAQKVKPFDVDIAWMSKFRNHERATFWSADSDEERISMIASARNGGSITPRFAKILDQHVKHGRVTIRSHSIVTTQAYDSATRRISVTTDPPIANMPPFDHVFFATGTKGGIEDVEFLETLRQKHPIPAKNGLPCLTDDLKWNNDVPLFVTGKLAGLRLGPGAGNLEGARLGAERVAWAVEDHLQERGRVEVGAVFSDEERRKSDYVGGVGSKYASLEMSDQD